MLLLGACAHDTQETYLPEPAIHTLRIKGIAAEGTGSAPDLSRVDAFLFAGGKKYKTSLLDLAQGGDITVFGSAGLYFFTGQEFPEHPDGISEEDFRSIAFGKGLHDNSAPEFYAAAVAYGGTQEDGSDLLVNIKRGVARIDVDTSADPKTQINEITVEDAPEEILPFNEDADAPSGKTVGYTKSFDPPISGKKEDLFRVFGSHKPVHILLKGTYDGVPVSLRMALPAIERNKVYTLEVLNAGSSQSVQFTVSDWEDGDTVSGKPDISHRLRIDAAHSVIPDGVTVDYENNRVSVPSSGVEGMRLAFLSGTALTLAEVDGRHDDITVGAMTADGYEGGKVVSSLPLDIAPQGNGRLAYSFSLHLKNPSLTQAYDFVDVRVEQSPTQIDTVEMAGSVWMAFNARSSDLDDQVYPLDGLGVEEMYHKAWLTTIGGLFQFGRKYMYVPWQGYNPSNNLGNQEQDRPWASDTHMPCPNGYRIPTRSELRSLLPPGTAVPGTYTAGNGEPIDATLHTAGEEIQMSGFTGLQRYLKLTSGWTGKSLILPLPGYKGDKATAANPRLGEAITLWTDEWGPTGGYAWLFYLEFKRGNTAKVSENQYQKEGFCSVRCVKKQ